MMSQQGNKVNLVPVRTLCPASLREGGLVTRERTTPLIITKSDSLFCSKKCTHGVLIPTTVYLTTATFPGLPRAFVLWESPPIVWLEEEVFEHQSFLFQTITTQTPIGKTLPVLPPKEKQLKRSRQCWNPHSNTLLLVLLLMTSL